jgi:hypothetical protein
MAIATISESVVETEEFDVPTVGTPRNHTKEFLWKSNFTDRKRRQQRERTESGSSVAVDSTAPVESVAPEVSELKRIKHTTMIPRRFTVLQHWEGVVTEVCSDSFWAELRDLTEFGNPSDLVEIPLSDISDNDKPLVEPGSMFYWNIGYEKSNYGQISRVSEIRLRRTPVWTKSMLKRVDQGAENLLRRLADAAEDNTPTD